MIATLTPLAASVTLVACVVALAAIGLLLALRDD